MITTHTLLELAGTNIVCAMRKNLENTDTRYIEEIVNIEIRTSTLGLPKPVCDYLKDRNKDICLFQNTPGDMSYVLLKDIKRNLTSKFTHVLLKDRKRNLISKFNVGDISRTSLTVTQLDITNTEIINAIFNESEYIIYDIYSCYEIIKYLIKLEENIDDVLRESLITTLNKYAKVYPEYCKLVDIEQDYLEKYFVFIGKQSILKSVLYSIKKFIKEDITDPFLRCLYIPNNKEISDDHVSDIVKTKIETLVRDIASCKILFRYNEKDTSMNTSKDFDCSAITIIMNNISVNTSEGFDSMPITILFSIKNTIHEYISIYKNMLYEIDCRIYNIETTSSIFQSIEFNLKYQ
jgi:hypothetical protein